MVAFLYALQWGTAQTVTTLLTQPGAQFEGITWATDGRIYVVDFATADVYKINLTGETNKIATLRGALGGAIDAAGNYYVSEFNTGNIIKFDREDNSNVYVSGLVGPAGILVDDANQIMYIANYSGNSIAKVDMSAENPTPTILASAGRINGPDGLALTPEGDLISCNFNDNNIQRITPEGEVTAFATLEGSPNSGYIVRRGDQYIVPGAYGPDIYTLSLTGEVSRFAGTGAAGYTDGAASESQFRFPNGIAISPTGDTLLITESATAGHIRMLTNLDGVSNTDVLQSVQAVRISPNPASERVHIEMYLVEASNLQINIIDLSTNVVDTLFAQSSFQGQFSVDFDLPNRLAPGAYFVQIQAGKELQHYTLVVRE